MKRLCAALLATALGAGAAGAQSTQDAGEAGTLQDRLGPSATSPQTSASPATSEGPLLPVPAFGGAEPGTAASEALPQTSDGAYGAYQRGLYISAFRIAEPLANLGDVAAQTLLGELYLRGLGVARDESEAARWYSVAADAGEPQAQFRLAMMLIEGEGVAVDLERARDLMRQSADAGSAEAAFNYGQMLIEASPSGGFADAFGYFESAAEEGLADGQYALAQLYAFGRGAEQSDTLARRWLHAAAIRGHETAQLELGIWLINGRGGPADPLGGFRWLKGAAERGNPIAINRLAHLYRDGIGTTRDAQEAAKWAVLARRAGNGDAALDNFLQGLPAEMRQRALEEANRFQRS